VSGNGKYRRSSQEERLATALWLVCEDAAIPFATEDLAKKYLAQPTLRCTLEHRLVTLNLNAINFPHSRQHWLAHAYSLTQADAQGYREITGTISLHPNALGPYAQAQTELQKALQNPN